MPLWDRASRFLLYLASADRRGMEAQEALHEGREPLPVLPKGLRDRFLFTAVGEVEAAFAPPLPAGNGGPSLATDIGMPGRAQQAPIRGMFRGPKACPTPLGRVYGSGCFWVTSCRSMPWTEVPTYAGASLELLGLVEVFPGADQKHQATQRRK